MLPKPEGLCPSCLVGDHRSFRHLSLPLSTDRGAKPTVDGRLGLQRGDTEKVPAADGVPSPPPARIPRCWGVARGRGQEGRRPPPATSTSARRAGGAFPMCLGKISASHSTPSFKGNCRLLGCLVPKHCLPAPKEASLHTHPAAFTWKSGNRERRRGSPAFPSSVVTHTHPGRLEACALHGGGERSLGGWVGFPAASLGARPVRQRPPLRGGRGPSAG